MTDEWAQLVDQRIARLETSNAVDEVVRATVESRLHAIEDMLKWMIRLVMGGLIMAMVAYVVAGGMALSV